MPIAAVPKYLGKDFSQASPGLRFGMYLPLWGTNQRSEELLWSTHDIAYEVRGQQQQEREVKKENKVTALQQASALSAADKQIGKAMFQRQNQIFDHMPTAQGLRLHATAVAPFTTGLGNEHPLENGFAFLNPYGLPYLPGSGVKGVLRTAAKELASGQWAASDWEHSKGDLKRHQVHEHNKPNGQQGKHLFNASDIDVLFGSEALDGENHLRGVLSFWDVIPQIEGNSLMVEIMTPHQSHYYQEDAKKGAGSTSPHDSGALTPISFLTVPPKSQFAFHVVCNTTQLEHLAPDLAANERWKVLLTEAFEHAFAWLGFGAKTSVGYGAMISEDMLEKQQEVAKKREHTERELRKQKDAERQQQNAQAWTGAKVKFNRANKSLSVEKDGQTAVAIQPKGEELLNTLPADMVKKITGNQFLKVTAFVAEGVLVKVQPSP
ncbi:MAG: type III-B CRISPR module RAMP protein Cmr6 [Polaromonas sp.]|jgi:CRISPR-associated protein Cmr6